MGESSKPRTGRPGRQVVVDAATALASSATLSDLLRFLTDRAVADEAGVQPGTVHYHFGARRGSRSLPLLVLRSLIDQEPTEETERTRHEIETAIARDPGTDEAILDDIRIAAAQNLRETFTFSTSTMGLLLAAAVAPNDPDATAEMMARYDAWTADFAAMYEHIASTLDRGFRDDIDIDAEMLAVFITALFDGLLMRHRFDERVNANPAVPEIFGEMVIRLFVAATEDDRGPDDLQELGGRLFDAMPAPAAVTDEQVAAIIAAMVDVYSSGGVAALGASRVAERARVPRGAVNAVARGRANMAAVVWGHLHFERLRSSLESDRANDSLSLFDILNRHLVNLVDFWRRDMDLTRLLADSLLGGLTRFGPANYDDTSDPRARVALPPLLAGVILEHHEELRPGVGDSDERALAVAATLINVTLIRSLTSVDEPATQLVDHIVTTTLHGIAAS